MSIHFSLNSEALCYAWRQLAERAGVFEGNPTGTGFEGLPIEVYYCLPGDVKSDKPRIIVAPCCKSAWEELLMLSDDSLDWVGADRVMPNAMQFPIGNKLPVIFWGEGYEDGNKPFVEQKPDGSIVFYADIIASTFLMLSRWEETVIKVRDEHDRFPGEVSVAFRQNFLDRPIIDEYAMVLQAWLKLLLPDWMPKPREGGIFVTCDVDRPYDHSLKTPLRIMRRIAGDILKRRAPGMARKSISQAILRMRGDWSSDPYNTFDWMMDTCEKADKKIAFYLLCQSASEIDARYELSEVFIKQLLKRIHDRKHEIGMHGSYHTYQNRNKIRQERAALIDTCNSQGIDQVARGNRQHFLRWDATQTPDHLDAVGFEYDTTGCFLNKPGFRYGTSRPFPMWSWQKFAPLKIKQRPLVMMEASIVDDCYMGLGYTDEALNLMLTLKERVLNLGGEFTLLWHNSHFMNAGDQEFFKLLIN